MDSALEAMKRLQEAAPFVMNERAGAAFCFACGSYDTHAADCPMLSLPKIVAAFETLERISKDEHEDGCPVPTAILMRCFCSQTMAQSALGGGEATT